MTEITTGTYEIADIERSCSHYGGVVSKMQRQLRPFLPLLLLLSVAVAATLASSRLTPDGLALLSLKNSVSDPSSALDNWNSNDSTPCHWHGVACNSLVNFSYPRVVSVSVVGRNLSGSIPPQLGALDQLRRLSLHDNNLTGFLPPELFNASALRSIFLQGNRITGEIPLELGQLNRLQNLDLSGNLLYGIIPDSIVNCHQLQRLVLASNFLSGYLPDGIGANLTALEVLDLSANRLSGPIPRDLGNLSSLESTLNLSYNLLSGSIPDSLGNLPYTVSLDLSHNNLTGRIPQAGSLADQGPGPFIGNPALCGFPLSRPCPVAPYVAPLPSLPGDGAPTVGPFGAQMPPSNMTKRTNLGTGAIIAIAIGDAAGISILGAILVYFYWKTSFCESKCCAHKKSSHPCFKGSSEESEGSSDKVQEQGELVALDKGFSYELDELLRASAYVLGKGGLGIVYKVVLGNGLPVAVRRLGEGGAQRFKEFEAEVQAIARVRHPNVVRLRAYYWAEDEKLLIYDYIPNGSVTAVLHGHSQWPSRALTWAERLRIAKGTAAGLAFLHESSPRKYVHGDMKASKVLLDLQLQPYIADLGLARLASIAGGPGTAILPPPLPSQGGRTTIATTSTASSIPPPIDWHATRPTSSTFYRAPEAASDPKPTQKWDVFSFGVILLELLSGRSPSAQLASFGDDLVSWMGRAFQDQKPLSQILDPALVAETSAEKEIVDTLHIALACTASSPDQRPKMRSVCESLYKISPHHPLSPS